MYKNFIQLCLDGEVFLDEIDDYVKKWHENSDINCDLGSYIGLTEYESEKWMQEGNDILRDILYCRRCLIDYEDYESMSHDKRIAARSNNIEDVMKIKKDDK